MAPSIPQPEAPYVVGRPRASDAIGCALRDVFMREAVPEEMRMLLGRLNDSDTVRAIV